MKQEIETRPPNPQTLRLLFGRGEGIVFGLHFLGVGGPFLGWLLFLFAVRVLVAVLVLVPS